MTAVRLLHPATGQQLQIGWACGVGLCLGVLPQRLTRWQLLLDAFKLLGYPTI